MKIEPGSYKQALIQAALWEYYLKVKGIAQDKADDVKKLYEEVQAI